MDLNLKYKTALITGSTAGIGLAIAKILSREGAKVIVNGRSKDRVDAAVNEIKSDSNNSGSIEGVVADLTLKAGRDFLRQQLPHVDILINNLGVYDAKVFEEVVADDWHRMFETNVLTGAELSQFYLRGMKSKNWGRIIFIGSEAGVNIPADMIPYGVSKAAQIALSRGLAETTAGTNVTVNAVLPGPTHSEGINRFLDSVVGTETEGRIEMEKEFLRKLRPTSLIQRFAEADEVASLVAYLVSPLASATNGAAVKVEGGLLRNFI